MVGGGEKTGRRGKGCVYRGGAGAGYWGPDDRVVARPNNRRCGTAQP